MTTDVTILDYGRLDLSLHPEDRSTPVAAYLAGLAPGSRRTMRQALRWIAEDFSTGRANENTFPWCLLRYEQTQEIRTRLAARYAAATANKMLSALRGVLKECWRLGQLDTDAMARAGDLRPVKGDSKPTGRRLTDKELWLLGVHANAMPKGKALVVFMYTTGLRRAEVAALRWQDIVPSPQGPMVRVYGKGSKVRMVPLPLSGYECLPQGPHTDEDLIFKMSPSRIWQVLREASFDAGIPPVAPHDLRRTYATTLLSKGVDLPTVQRLMGHADPKTTASYDRRSDIEAYDAVAKVFG